MPRSSPGSAADSESGGSSYTDTGLPSLHPEKNFRGGMNYPGTQMMHTVSPQDTELADPAGSRPATLPSPRISLACQGADSAVPTSCWGRCCRRPGVPPRLPPMSASCFCADCWEAAAGAGMATAPCAPPPAGSEVGPRSGKARGRGGAEGGRGGEGG